MTYRKIVIVGCLKNDLKPVCLKLSICFASATLSYPHIPHTLVISKYMPPAAVCHVPLIIEVSSRWKCRCLPVLPPLPHRPGVKERKWSLSGPPGQLQHSRLNYYFPRAELFCRNFGVGRKMHSGRGQVRRSEERNRQYTLRINYSSYSNLPPLLVAVLWTLLKCSSCRLLRLLSA